MTPRGIFQELLRRLSERRHPRITVGGTVAHALDVPDPLPQRQAIVVGADGAPQWLAMTCPCRKGHQLLLNMSTARYPRWTLHCGRVGDVTLIPSVDSHSDAGRCHFWLHQGHVRWVQPPASRERSSRK